MDAVKFESASFLVLATDETDALITTVESLMELCNAEDIDQYLIIYPKNVAPETAKIISDLEAKYPNKVVGYEQIRPGIGGAIKDGMDFATSSHVIFMVADLAIELAAIPKVIEKAKEHPNAVVKTSRWMEGGGFFGCYSPVRKFFNRIAQSFLRVLFLGFSASAIAAFTSSSSSPRLFQGRGPRMRSTSSDVITSRSISSWAI